MSDTQSRPFKAKDRVYVNHGTPWSGRVGRVVRDGVDSLGRVRVLLDGDGYDGSESNWIAIEAEFLILSFDVEEIFDAPTDPSTGAVTAPTPSPVDDSVPSLVELDRRDEMRSLLAGAIWHSTGGVGTLHDFGHTYAVDPFVAADAILAGFEVKAVSS